MKERCRPGWGDLQSLSVLDLSNNPGLTGPLPASLVGLGLTVLRLGGTGLCAPPDPAYQAWLATVGNIRVDNCPADVGPDRVALTTLYGETGGAHWKEAANWLSEAPLRDWHGVETDDEGHVTSIDLQYNNLQGRLPPELALMDRLEVLRLYGNGLRGPIPPELARLDRAHCVGTIVEPADGAYSTRTGTIGESLRPRSLCQRVDRVPSTRTGTARPTLLPRPQGSTGYMVPSHRNWETSAASGDWSFPPTSSRVLFPRNWDAWKHSPASTSPSTG